MKKTRFVIEGGWRRPRERRWRPGFAHASVSADSTVLSVEGSSASVNRATRCPSASPMSTLGFSATSAN
eukprot:4669311-Heterocapsa_arctica.AAC.1